MANNTVCRSRQTAFLPRLKPGVSCLFLMMPVTCPRCGYPQHCGCCPSCRRRIPEGILPYTWTDDGESCICPNCGLTLHADQWLDIGVQPAAEHR